MTTTSVLPRTDTTERVLALDDLIITKTDLQGRLTYCNDTFLRFSALTEAEALGKPHNLIRHPDMPAGVFTLLWQRAAAGHELFAFIRNLALDGTTYWVLAYVTQSYEDRDGRKVPIGYHSMRRSPRREALPEVQEVYAQMRAVERNLPRKQAGEAGLAWLEDHLASRGLTYDTWLWGLEGLR